MKIKSYSIILVILLFISYPLFCGQEQSVSTNSTNSAMTNPVRSTQTAQSTDPVRRVAGMRVNYFALGMNFGFISQDVDDSTLNTETDVKFFTYDIAAELQYLFRHMILKVSFDYSKFNVKMYYDTNGVTYTHYNRYRKKIINATLGYTNEFSNKYALIFPAIGFGYQDYDNPIRDTHYRCEMYYLILNTRFYINIHNVLTLGFDLDFRLILSHIATLDYQTYGNSRVILRKGLNIYFRVPMKFSIGSYFFISVSPWIQIIKLPQTNGILIDLDDGTQRNEAFYKNTMVAGGIKLLFGVYLP